MPFLDITRSKRLHVLAIGAHADDIEIGCGGALLELIANHHAHVTWVVLSGTEERRREAEKAAGQFLAMAAGSEVRVEQFRDGFFPTEHESIKSSFEALKREIPAPDVIFTHFREDLHQDHRLSCELTWNTFRNHTILEYEIPKWDGDLGRPNLYVPLSKAALARKVEVLMSVYGSQANRHWFTPETFEGLARLRGIECRSPTGVAEAFHSRKLVLEMSR